MSPVGRSPLCAGTSRRGRCRNCACAVHRRWVAPVVALAAVAVVVVGLIAIGTNRNESVGNDPARLRWLLRDVPSGWRATTVFDSTTAPARRALPNPFVTNVYATDAEPLGPSLTVQGTTDTTQSIDIGSYSGDVLSYEEFDLDGKRAAFATLPNGGRGLYVEINSAWVYMSSRGLSDEVLRGLARTLTPDAAGHYDVAGSALPDRYAQDRLGERSAARLRFDRLLALRTTVGPLQLAIRAPRQASSGLVPRDTSSRRFP